MKERESRNSLSSSSSDILPYAPATLISCLTALLPRAPVISSLSSPPGSSAPYRATPSPSASTSMPPSPSTLCPTPTPVVFIAAVPPSLTTWPLPFPNRVAPLSHTSRKPHLPGVLPPPSSEGSTSVLLVTALAAVGLQEGFAVLELYVSLPAPPSPPSPIRC